MTERDLASAPLAELFRLDGRTVVITGGAAGIGRAIGMRMAESGGRVVIADIDGAAAGTTAQEIQQAHGGVVRGTLVDVADRVSVEAAAAFAEAEVGPIDVWVNNAGIYPMVDPLAVEEEVFERIFRINVLGTQFGVQAASRRMIDGGRRGVIVNIASTAAFRGPGPYSASKWAVRGLTNGLAAPLGAHGIRVVALAPSITETPGMEELRTHAEADFVAGVAAANPLGRTGQPDDIARAAVFVASDAGAYITATTVVVDGGSLAAL